MKYQDKKKIQSDRFFKDRKELSDSKSCGWFGNLSFLIPLTGDKR